MTGPYVKLPPFNVLARVLVGDDNDQLGDLAADHPLVELRHDLLDVGAHLVVGRDQHVEAIFLDGGEVLGGVNASLEAALLLGLAWSSRSMVPSS